MLSAVNPTSCIRVGSLLLLISLLLLLLLMLALLACVPLPAAPASMLTATVPATAPRHLVAPAAVGVPRTDCVTAVAGIALTGACLPIIRDQGCTTGFCGFLISSVVPVLRLRKLDPAPSSVRDAPALLLSESEPDASDSSGCCCDEVALVCDRLRPALAAARCFSAQAVRCSSRSRCCCLRCWCRRQVAWRQYQTQQHRSSTSSEPELAGLVLLTVK